MKKSSWIFCFLRRVTPAGLVALVATVVRWRREHHPVAFAGLAGCPITGYLQRMDVLALCAVDAPESFQRHDARGRFVPARFIDHRVDEMGTDLAECIAPGGEDYEHPLSDLYSLAWFVLTETANNVRQHSQGMGYVAAQVNRQEGMVRLAIADNGRGILRSFRDAGLPWSTGLSDAEAIRKALEPEVSSKGGPANEGVGLTLVAGLVRLIGGWMMMVSGTGVLTIRKGREPELTALPSQRQYQGTLLGMTFRQQDVRDYAGLLERAKVTTGRLPPGVVGVMFRP
jgi:anti-sigma regulatory factor (Ser/Thr protein kinase)